MGVNELFDQERRPRGDGETAVAVGDAIRARRHQLGLSLRELGERAGLSVSFLSQVERGQSSLALGSLAAVARALETDAVTLLPGSRGGSEPVPQREGATVHVTRADGATEMAIDARVRRYKMLAGPHERTLEPMLLTILPTETRSEALRSREGERFIYVLEGELAYFLGDEEHRLCAGDSIHHHATVPHAFVNDTDGTVKALSVTTPPTL